MRQLRVTVSGSFTRHLDRIQKAVAELKARGVRVLSPEQPVIVDALEGFVFVASDRHRSVKLVQDRHLASIADSDFLWLEADDGYVGQSAALELGYAIGVGIPVYSVAFPSDLTMRQYVRRVPSLAAAITLAESRVAANDHRPVSLLVDPRAAIESAVVGMDKLRDLLTRPQSIGRSAHLADEVASEH